MIEVTAAPGNEQHFSRLMAFARDMLSVCDDIGLVPFLDGSLAVFAYTQDAGMDVHDLDLNCSEAWFPRLLQALESQGFDAKVTDWHVLQVRRDGLKVEFGATEYWMQEIPDAPETARIGDIRLAMVSLDDLRKLYRRGLVATSETGADQDAPKHRAIAKKLRLLDAVRT